MILSVTGSRTITDARIVDYVLMQVVHDLPEIQWFFHGGAAGVDTLSGQWATEHSLKVKIFNPDWKQWPRAQYKNRAYLERDINVVDAADWVVAIWDGESHGTKYTLEYARNKLKLHSVWLEKEVREELGLL